MEGVWGLFAVADRWLPLGWGGEVQFQFWTSMGTQPKSARMWVGVDATPGLDADTQAYAPFEHFDDPNQFAPVGRRILGQVGAVPDQAVILDR